MWYVVCTLYFLIGVHLLPQRSRTSVAGPVLNKPVLTMAQTQQVNPPVTTTFLEPQQYVAAIPVQPVLAAAGFPGTVVTSLPPPPEVCNKNK